MSTRGIESLQIPWLLETHGRSCTTIRHTLTPYAFKPERFLMLDGEGNLKLDPSAPIPEAAFGFGRRICPGRHMATSSLWISIACILATFNVTKALDEHGREIEPSYEFDSGFINSPLPFKCSIRPRSEQAGALIQAAAENLESSE
ncbi:Cytochrome P450 [Mycena venus]|uniref:Cytochrome P450 n=1 Tax=Mycena venus TaxID=2733690 RepID=A0A8H7CR18_9AGAR|nr:Cytochrome P450 [Mycena venus]